jgi:hypothetical protein
VTLSRSVTYPRLRVIAAADLLARWDGMVDHLVVRVVLDWLLGIRSAHDKQSFGIAYQAKARVIRLVAPATLSSTTGASSA